MKTIKASELTAGDTINRCGFAVKVISATPAIHPLGYETIHVEHEAGALHFSRSAKIQVAK